MVLLIVTQVPDLPCHRPKKPRCESHQTQEPKSIEEKAEAAGQRRAITTNQTFERQSSPVFWKFHEQIERSIIINAIG